MRNPELDKELPIDNKIGKLKGNIRKVNGKDITQIEEKTQADIDMNLIINRVRASGMSPSEYLKMMYH